MHECLLFASVPDAQHKHVLRVLAGISAMQPTAVRNCHIVFKPTRNASSLPTTLAGRPPAGKPGATNPFPSGAGQTSNDLFYLQLVGDFTYSHSQSTKEIERERERERENAGDMEIDVTTTTATTTDANANANANADVPDERGPESTSPPSSEETLWSTYPWTLNYAGVPEVPGKRPATSRLTSRIPLTHENQRLFMHGLGYSYVASYIVAGYRLTHGHLDITLCRTYPLDETTSATTVAAQREIPVAKMLALGMGARLRGGSADEDGDGDFLEGLHEVRSLDASGGFLLQVSARVSDGAKPELMSAAFAELSAFHDLLRGVVRLQPGERMALDTRVRAAGGVQAVQGRNVTAVR